MPNLPIERRGLLAGGPDAPPLDEGVKTVAGPADYEKVLGRELAFPLYLALYGGSTPTDGGSLLRRSMGYNPGRVLICTREPGTPRFSNALWSQLGTGDVPLVSLYENGEPLAGVKLRSSHQETEAILRDVGPQVYAVLTGHANDAETGFIVHITQKDDNLWRESVRATTEFVKMAGGRIRDCGGRPAFGLYQFQILIHAYRAAKHLEGGDPLLKALQDLQALVICFVGYAFVLCPLVMQPLDHWDPAELYVAKSDLDGPPWMMLQNWLRGVECWGGVNYMPGLMAGHDTKMAALGFKAGVIGAPPWGNPNESASETEKQRG